MRVVVALPDAVRVVDRLRAGGHGGVRGLTRDELEAAAGAAESDAPFAAADVLIVAASRAWLTGSVVALCDRTGTRIVAWSASADERRAAERLGVAVVDAGTDPLEAVHALPSSAPIEVTRGRVIVVWGAAGAPGRTTLAIELARELGRGDRGVALADADTHAPAVAVALGIPDEGPGLAGACRRAARDELTAAELARIAEPAGGFDVLAGINRVARWPEVAAPRLQRVLEIGRLWVDDLVVDVAASLERDEEIVSDLDGPRRNAATIAALEAADMVVAVTAADPVALARFLKTYPDLRAVVGSTPVHVVVNKLRAGALGIDARGQIRRSLERYAGVERCWFVPCDPRATDAALLAARPVGEGNGRGAIPAAVRRLVGEAVSPPEPRARGRRRDRDVVGAAGVRSAP
ncbi:hypothetical protein [Microbacterium sp. cf332]|uniref:AAA family ATPase n=1 Tax=Microbacterium sp. cf332 TaxID=1761804 RepID=UPI000887C407|nr:hypothetical protein [Microbacterium sp. cf332]SDQ80566.1 MinD-like ATPase involved in chromosome partitioning or flagellar assembly [Microbacterium sp. cf332]